MKRNPDGELFLRRRVAQCVLPQSHQRGDVRMWVLPCRCHWIVPPSIAAIARVNSETLFGQCGLFGYCSTFPLAFIKADCNSASDFPSSSDFTVGLDCGAAGGVSFDTETVIPLGDQ